jgi:hypothetical protein
MARRSIVDLAGDTLALPPLPPAPSGPLTVRVDCWIGGRAIGRHDVTLGRDWSVSGGPHDMEVERVAAALGAPSSCLQLAQRVVPAVRDVLQAVARRCELPIVPSSRGRWRLPDRRIGCCRHEYDDPLEAAAHARSTAHAAKRYFADAEQVDEISKQVLSAYGGPGAFEPDLRSLSAVAWVDPPEGLLDLWNLGVNPATVQQIWYEGIRRPATVEYYMGVVAMKPDLAWIRSTAGANPADKDLPAHLAWTEMKEDLADPTARAAWLRIGAPREFSQSLTSHGITPGHVREFALATGLRPSAAAERLCMWVRTAGTLPPLRTLAALYAAGVPVDHELSPVSVARLSLRLKEEGHELELRDVALMLVVARSVPAAVAWVKAGHRDPVEVARTVADGQAGPSQNGGSDR